MCTATFKRVFAASLTVVVCETVPADLPVVLFSTQAFKENEEAKRRLVDSYELMLGFYGIQLLNHETGEVRRAENWRERFANLERSVSEASLSLTSLPYRLA